jgi:iron complex outermembrane recepter protein
LACKDNGTRAFARTIERIAAGGSMKPQRRPMPHALGAAAISALSVGALAQPATSAAPQAAAEDRQVIYITTQQRLQRLQDVPLSVTALSGSFVEENHLRDFSELAKFTPGFTSGSNYGFIRNSSMRGISNNQFGFADDPSIAMFVDNVYQGRGGSGSQVNALYDISRVEIVKGPQATLFGRSSIGGAISILTNQPGDKFEANALLGLGQRSRVVARGVVNVPLAPKFALRVALNSEDQDGYITNTNGGDKLQPLDVKAGRVLARYSGVEGLEVNAKIGHERRKQGGSIYQVDGLPDFTTNQTLRGRESYSDFEIQDAVLGLKFALSKSLSIESTTSQRHVKNRYVEDYDGLAAVIGGPYAQTSDDKLTQQDFRLTWTGADKLTVIAGASFFTEKLSAFVANNVDGNPSFTGFAFTGVPTPGLLPNDYSNAFYEEGSFDGKFSGQSVYVDATWPLAARWALTGGVRFNKDKKRYTQDIPDPAGLAQNAGKIFAGAYYNWGYFTGVPITSKKSWDNTAFRAALSFEVDPDMTAYAQWSQGWKAGGIDTFKVSAPPSFNLFFGLDAAAVGATPNVYDPEKSQSFELGLKGKTADRKLIYALALYRYDYKDLQVSVPQGGSSVIANVGKARGMGFEGELRLRPDEHWDLFANMSYNDTKIVSFPQKPEQVGQPLNQAPKITASAGASYRFKAAFVPGDLMLGASVSHRGKYRTDNQLVESVEAATLLDLRAGWDSADGRYSVTLFADNALDAFTYARANAAQPFLFAVGSRSVIGNPRTVGVDLRVSF